MTFSIYFANFFKKNDVKELMVSMETQMLTAELTEIPGAPGCTIFKTKSKEYPICFKDETIRKQIQAAAIKFLNCRPNPNNQLALEHALSGCDLSKVDLSKKGPFGSAGPKIHHVLEKMKEKKNKKVSWKGINPYYIKKGIPGDLQK